MLSDGLYFILFYLVRYRRKVVRENICDSFPDKNKEWINDITKKYYRHLADLVVENIKLLSISREDIKKRCTYENMDLIDGFLAEKKSLVFVMGHHGNWEWANPAFTLHSAYKTNVIYRPLSNKYFDALFVRMRSRFGGKPLPAGNVMREMLSEKDTTSVTVFIADQTPSPADACWVNFLGRPTAVYEGTEKIARKFNYPVIFAEMKKIKRGFYSIRFNMIAANPAGTADKEITTLHTTLLEKEIRIQPEIWLWSHRRWKHAPPVK